MTHIYLFRQIKMAMVSDIELPDAVEEEEDDDDDRSVALSPREPGA